MCPKVVLSCAHYKFTKVTKLAHAAQDLRLVNVLSCEGLSWILNRNFLLCSLAPDAGYLLLLISPWILLMLHVQHQLQTSQLVQSQWVHQEKS